MSNFEFLYKTQQDCVCAGCYGQVTLVTVKGEQMLTCQKCGDYRGVVTRAYAQRRQSESVMELRNVMNTLGQVLQLPEPKKQTTAEILADLGF